MMFGMTPLVYFNSMFQKIRNLMYYTAFFIDYRPLLAKLFEEFIKRTALDYKSLSSRYSDPSGFLNQSTSYPYPNSWCLYGEGNNNISYLFKQLEMLSTMKNSLSDFDCLFSSVAQNSNWAIFPWGGHGDFAGFVFTSSNKYLRDLFTLIADEIINSKNLDIPIPLYDSIYHKYDVVKNLSHHIRSLIFNIRENAGIRIWEVCKCEVNHPIYLVNDPEPEIQYEQEIDTEQCGFLDLGNHCFMRLLCVTSRKEFNLTCSEALISEKLAIVVSSDTDFAKLGQILPLFSKYGGEIGYFNKILSSTGWFFGLGRDREHTGHSIFISDNNGLLRGIDSMNTNDDYSLISCL